VDILQGEIRKNGISNLIISVSKVAVTTDLSVARVHLSIFPQDKAKETLEGIKSNAILIKHDLSQRVRLQLRKVPNLTFYIDDSLDYIEKIDNALSKKENPIEDRSLLEKRKKYNLNFSLYIAKRYLFSKSKSSAINIITRIASAGIIIGAMALFVVLSVFSGLKVFSLSFSNNFDPDLKITATKGKSLVLSQSQSKQLLQVKGIQFQSKIVDERVLFMFNGKEEVASLKGVDSLYGKVNAVKKTLFNGQWLLPNSYQVVVGYGISEKLSLGLFDYTSRFEVFVPKPGKGAIENPEDAFSKTSLIPIGIYAISEDLDSKYVFADLGLAQELLQYQPNQITAIECKLAPNANEERIKEELQTIFIIKLPFKTEHN